MDISHSERVEKDLDAFIGKREKQRLKDEEQQAVEDLWAISARRAEQKRREEENARRREFHEGQAARLRGVMTSLIRHHEAEARKYRNGHGGGA